MLAILGMLLVGGSFAQTDSSCEPASPLVQDTQTGLDMAFCAEWDPEFAFRGNTCCGKIPFKLKRRGVRADPARSLNTFCGDRTEEQVEYQRQFDEGQIDDPLEILTKEMGQSGVQAIGHPFDGFLVRGKPVLAKATDGIRIRRPDRCVNFGTDQMVALLEWLGREVRQKYPGPEYARLQLLVGDVSAPRGRGIKGKGGKRGHRSHQTGLDVDLGFLDLHENRASSQEFIPRFDVEPNWWVLKKVFSNPYACVRMILLDHGHERKIERALAAIRKKDETHPDLALWDKVKKYIKHAPRHRNHFHIRVENEPRTADCESAIAFTE